MGRAADERRQRLPWLWAAAGLGLVLALHLGGPQAAWWALLIPVLARQRRRRLRRSAGRCEGCGYDLRGIGDRCPECGKSATRSGEVAEQA